MGNSPRSERKNREIVVFGFAFFAHVAELLCIGVEVRGQRKPLSLTISPRIRERTPNAKKRSAVEVKGQVKNNQGI